MWLDHNWQGGGGVISLKKKACSNLQEGWDGANQMDTINMGFFCNYVWEQGFFWVDFYQNNKCFFTFTPIILINGFLNTENYQILY
jgi:hypothetical protein